MGGPGSNPDTATGSGSRIASIDIVRGAVMVLMAIDHVRVFSGVPAGGLPPAIFFTRWITHFCAPAFVFFAGTGAFLHGRKLASRGSLTAFLAIRGLWLVLLELTVLRVSWTFNFDYAHYLLAGVIWGIGWSMVLLAVLVWLPTAVVGAFGVLVIAGHDALAGWIGNLPQSAPDWSWLWQILYLDGPLRVGADGPVLAILYVIVPWVGVMASGYAFGAVMLTEPARRRRICFALGLGMTAAFLVLRAFDLYGDPGPWRSQPERMGWLAFLNTSKYPGSLQFFLMTLGPTIALLPLLDRARGPVARVLTVFGRVPLFYYLLHIPLIHLAFVLLSLARFGEVVPWLFANHPMGSGRAPDDYRYPLWSLYAVTAVVVTLLYFPCRWFAELKQRRRDAWLSFL
ncbi:MAG TPA: heparan-alpha-glucosaminide N-acetyltransferase domain-containing protein, partial [Planctomycetota bacterium]|nr:heparan-alpha-glucosaminide N-acetyltransferase domain-containing protein [Planctomycetota bacterium]